MEKGDCYKENLFLALKIQGKLIHGTVFAPRHNKRIIHAWVEKGDNVFDATLPIESFAKEEYYNLANAQIDKIYSYKEASLMTVKTNNFGPWTEQERKEFLHDQRQKDHNKI